METTSLKLELLPIGEDALAKDAAKPAAPAPELRLDMPAPKRATPGVEVVGEAPAPALADPDATGDRFLKEATKQYIEGHVDSPLWDRALAQANGDKEQATPIYLAARATALRVLDREIRAKNLRAVQAADHHATTAARPRPRPKADDVYDQEPSPRRSGVNYKVVGAVGGTFAVVALGVWLFVGLRGNDAAAVAPVKVAAVQPAGPTAEEKAAAKAEHEKREQAVFMAKIGELNETKNWNVLVLYANEWTRREPANPAAWTQLSIGYTNLRQFADAQNAATQAVKLAPQDPRVLRNLGQLSMAANKPEEALLAYEGAAALDERDAESLVQSGILHARLGHLPEAQRAIDKALVIVPEDPQSQCLRNLLAQRSRAPKDAAPARAAAASASPCSELIDVAPTVAVAESSPAKTARPQPRR